MCEKTAVSHACGLIEQLFANATLFEIESYENELLSVDLINNFTTNDKKQDFAPYLLQEKMKTK